MIFSINRCCTHKPYPLIYLFDYRHMGQKAVKYICVCRKEGKDEAEDFWLSPGWASRHSLWAGMQVYSGNFIGGTKGKNGRVYGPHDGNCLEPQFFPNAMAIDGFEKPILRAGETYLHETVYGFSVN